jgi:hypothetical protein
VSLLGRLLIRAAPATPADSDAIALRKLIGLGADLARPRHVIHTLVFADERGARTAAESIARGGYETTVVGAEASGEPWSVRAEGVRVVSPSTVSAFRAWFERVAAEHDGAYYGWEASRKP